jgi:hypothetical protein
VGAGRQGERLGESGPFDRGTDQGIDELSGDCAAGRWLDGRSPISPGGIAGARGASDRGGPGARRQAGWFDERALDCGRFVSRSTDCSSGNRAVSASPRRGSECRDSRKSGPGIFAGWIRTRAGRTRGLVVRSDGTSFAKAGFGHCAPPGPIRRLLGDAPHRWPAFGTYVSSRGQPADWLGVFGSRPAPRAQARAAWFVRVG